MDTIKVQVGTERTLRSGQVDQNLRPVEFEAEQLARETSYHGDDDTRGVTETLYRTEEGRLIVYLEDWTRWVGETSDYWLHEIEQEDLEHGGRFEALGVAAGFGRPLTLQEALA